VTVGQEESLYLRLELVAPRGLVFEGDVEMVVLPAVTGELGILPRHAPLVAQLSIGRLRALTVDGQWLNFAVAEGFAKVQFNKVIVLADTAEEAGDIDVERVQRSIERATQRLEMHRLGTVPEGEEVDPYREQLALRRARNRLKVAQQA
jgi:F-type H+-transporting ATPase subunit epsilon